ncbi:MAG: response regulator [Marinilabiliales bacterium]|nr:MAG: response regulator [Marinilabiliales bacterium]
MNNPNEIRYLRELFKSGQAETETALIVKGSFDVLGVFILAADINGRIVFMNKRACEVLEMPGADVWSELSFTDLLIDKDEKERVKSGINSLLAGGQAQSMKSSYRLQSRSGSERIIEAQTIKVDEDGTIKGILIAGKDFTEYSRTSEILKKDFDLYRVILNTIPGLNIFVFDNELRFILAEGNRLKESGPSSKYFIDKKLNEIPDRNLAKKWEEYLPEVLDGKRIEKEYKLKSNHYLLIGQPLTFEDNQVSTGIIIVRNITEEKLTEKILKRSKDEAVKAGKAKNRFLARVTHEIRTPLNAIMGFTEQLSNTELSPTQKKYVKIIDRSSELLLSLVNDILVMSKIEAGQISFERNVFSLRNSVEFVFKALSSKAERKNLGFRYKIDEKADRVIRGDPIRLQQILMNMLSNAIKFTKKGDVELACSTQKETDRDISIRFDVIDTGIGISEKHLKDIFNQYKRGDEEIEKIYEGTGIGLAICKNLIELQNGSLSVSSRKGTGTTFSFTLTYEKASEKDMLSSGNDNDNKEKLKGIRILLVDDDSLNLLLGKTILDKLNCTYDIADSGSRALDKIKNNRYDLILLDIHMPDIDGIKVAKHVRVKLKDNQTRIIAMTAAALRDDVMQFEKTGINDFIIKPFKEEYLFNKICYVMGREPTGFKESKTEIILKKEISPKPYNLAELQKMAGNDTEFMKQTLKLFIDNSNQAIERFRYYISEGNLEQIGETAHKLLPSYRHLEAQAVVRKLLILKKNALISKNHEGIEKLVDDTITEMKKVLSELKKEITPSEEQ